MGVKFDSKRLKLLNSEVKVRRKVRKLRESNLKIDSKFYFQAFLLFGACESSRVVAGWKEGFDWREKTYHWFPVDDCLVQNFTFNVAYVHHPLMSPAIFVDSVQNGLRVSLLGRLEHVRQQALLWRAVEHRKNLSLHHRVANFEMRRQEECCGACNDARCRNARLCCRRGLHERYQLL